MKNSQRKCEWQDAVHRFLSEFHELLDLNTKD